MVLHTGTFVQEKIQTCKHHHESSMHELKPQFNILLLNKKSWKMTVRLLLSSTLIQSGCIYVIKPWSFFFMALPPL